MLPVSSKGGTTTTKTREGISIKRNNEIRKEGIHGDWGQLPTVLLPEILEVIALKTQLILVSHTFHLASSSPQFQLTTTNLPRECTPVKHDEYQYMAPIQCAAYHQQTG